MGFGYLVLGSLVWLNPVYSGFTEWLAYTLMLSGTSRLAPYGKGFRLANAVGIPGLVLSFANFLLSGADLIGVFSYQSSTLYQIIMLALLFATLALRICILLGIFQITAETGIDKLKGRSIYCVILYSTVFVFELLQSTQIIEATPTGFTVILFAQLTVGIIAFSLCFSCLRMITLEGEEDAATPDEKDKKKNGWWQKIKEMSEQDGSENENGGNK